MCMERDINGLNYEKEEPNVQIAHAVHRLRGNTPAAGNPSILLADQEFLCRGHDRYYRSRTARKPFRPRPRRGYPAWYHDPVCTYRYRIGRGYRADDALHLWRLWQPFDKTLEAIEHFKLENGVCPQLAESNTKEFARLNTALQRLMTNSLNSYRLQKEFTENASHELQTPLAVFQSKLDLLLQQPELTERQADIIQDLYQMNSRLSRLNRNLLLLAKMENNQFSRTESVEVITVIKELQPYLESLSSELVLKQNFSADSLPIKANRSLLESMVNNLVVNAVRHNKTGGNNRILVGRRLTVSIRPTTRHWMPTRYSTVSIARRKKRRATVSDSPSSRPYAIITDGKFHTPILMENMSLR